jgi:hypothetical protein
VKKALRNIGLTGISLLYCFVIGISSGITYHADAAVLKHSKGSHETYKAAVSSKSFQHTVQTENAVTVFNHAKPVSVKHTQDDYSAHNKITEQLYVTGFAQYSFYSHKLLMRVQHTDLIFPFHYFW